MGSSVVGTVFVATLLLSQILGTPLDPSRPSKGVQATDQEAWAYLQNLEDRYSSECNKEMTARWEYITNVNDENEQASVEALNEYLAFQASVQKEILETFPNWKNEFLNETVKREFTYLATKGPALMDPELVGEMNTLRARMESAYASATVCRYNSTAPDPENCDDEDKLYLEPDLEEMLSSVTDQSDFDELAYYWTGWHDALSNAVNTSTYKRFIELQNELANANDYADMGELWASPYDDGSPDFSAKKFEDEMYAIWEDLRPYYEKLHAYVRMKLRKQEAFVDKIEKYGYLPANLMGNMWAQDWTALDGLTKPYPEETSVDATQAMIAAGYTPLKMFQVSDEFFQGLGLIPMSDEFYNKSMLEKPDDGTVVVCHASAEDFCLGGESKDFRIKMCTNVNQEDLVTVHHEMGHIEYFMQYSKQHFIFRDGANPGFHEAIGDALALAVTTPYHLQCMLKLDIGREDLCEESESPTPREVTNSDINFLYRMALEKFSFFPFAISMDSWRWGVFDGSITEDQYNSKWWEIRQKNQGVAPPSPRDPSGGLDAAAKYHIVGNVEYIRYFISHILQFQFYEAMCFEAGEYDPNNATSKPLYQCDFAGSEEAGTLFGDMMKLGFSEPWPVALEKITGNPIMTTDSLINYFKPLFDYFDEELQREKEVIGFGPEFGEVHAKVYIADTYESKASEHCNKASVAEFESNIDLLNTTKEEIATNASIEWSNFEFEEYEITIRNFDFSSFADKNLQRQLKFLSAIGTSALNDQDLRRYNEVLSEMNRIYGTGKICPYTKQNCNLETEGLPLEPDLTEILGELKDFDELAYIWEAWRNATGKKMRELYKEYVDLSNKAAIRNGFDNMGDFWLLRYESDTFKDDLEKVWQQVRTELYQPLYDYVRFKMSAKFPQMDPEGPIPAHVLGNMWSQTWEYVLPYVMPHPTEPAFDITNQLVNLTESPEYDTELKKRHALFEIANEFFMSLGLESMEESYQQPPAMVLKPSDKEVVCHASAWDMCDGQDFRLKMCTEINHQDFVTIHHELGHIQYYHQYKDLPITFREGANPGFHEAIGDVVALSVSTPKHLQSLGFVEAAPSDESMLNFLMQMALEKIAFLPFGYLIDSYRWQIFDGSIPTDKWTYNWVKMSAEYQGVVPPIKRSENDFDPGAKYHVPGNTPYIRYFVSFILQFQVHAELCKRAGNVEPLYNCDIEGNAAAGEAFKKMLQDGASKNWQDILLELTDGATNKLDAAPIISYFQPLLDFLKAQQEENKYYNGFNIGDIEDYIGEGPVGPEDPSSSSEGPEGPSTTTEEPEGNDVAAIVVGVILGIAVIVIVLAYFLKQRCRKA